MSTSSVDLRRMLERVSRNYDMQASSSESSDAEVANSNESTNEPANETEQIPQYELRGIGSSSQESATEQRAEITSEDIDELNAMFGLNLVSNTSASTAVSQEPTTTWREYASTINELHVAQSPYTQTSVAVNHDDVDDFLDVAWEDGHDTSEQEEPEQEEHTQNLGHSLSDYTTSRFSGALWFDEIRKQEITIVGAGGIGSWSALMLSRFCPKSIILYDEDTVDISNIAGQFYTLNQIGNYKVDAVSDAIKDYSGFFKTIAFRHKFTADASCTDIVISCLDNMYSRKVVFNRWLKRVESSEHPEKCLFVDGRLAAETLQVFSVCGNDDFNIKRYQDSLFRDDEAIQELCSYKQTSFMANMIGSVIANVVLNFVASKLDGGVLREVPFLVEYTSEMMYFKTVM